MTNKKILIVDDEERMRKLLKDFLSVSGYEILEAEKKDVSFIWNKIMHFYFKNYNYLFNNNEITNQISEYHINLQKIK